MGIITSLKKRFKYLYLKDVLDLYELDEEVKFQKKMLGQRLRRGVAGVAYGNPAHQLDAASYVKEAWQSVSSRSIKNEFIKAEIMTLEADQGAVNKNDDLETELVEAITVLNLFVSKKSLKNVHVDDENSEEFAVTVLEDVEELLKKMTIVEDDIYDDNDDDIIISQVSDSGLENTIVFKGFESLYKQVLDIDDQLFCSEFREDVEKTFDDLKKLFESF